MQPLALTNEELDAEILFELTNARGDVRLNPVKALGCAGHAASPHHGGEDAKVGEIHAIS
jgi:hypothetical protein